MSDVFGFTLHCSYIFGPLLKYILRYSCWRKFDSAVYCEFSDLCFTTLCWLLRK